MKREYGHEREGGEKEKTKREEYIEKKKREEKREEYIVED